MKRGLIQLSPELLLRFLDYYDGGQILDCRYNAQLDCIDIALSHPEMPEVEDGQRASIIAPSYIRYTDALGHSISLRERK